ncbi:unnamed protein product [Rotaria sordida]|nr:unnamed protein product [Rotaria sordida]CAF1282630.1 unnamed protein product [Rotaria sordida]CAF1532972.1 unnamed protein product [Rotaria sordida]CAF3696123.1 unnamed protein product [Rotaria sordida]CAF3889442.1 unnamed protein product [Rotaria sordida]
MQSNDNRIISIHNSSATFNMLQENNPLQIIADSRFHMIIKRAIQRSRITPLSPKQMIHSECSSWSSASIVSSIDLKTPEPTLHNEVSQKLEAINKTSRNGKLLIILTIFLVLLILIGIILSIVLSLTLIKNSSTETTTITHLVTTNI